MRFENLSAAAEKARPFKAPMLVVVISALAALLFTIATRPSASAPPRAAGEPRIGMIEDEHALVADLVRDLHAAVEAQRDAAQHSRQAMRVLAAAEYAAPAVPPSRPQAPAQPMAMAAKPPPAAGQPLQLQPAAGAPPSPPPVRSVARPAKAALAVVEHIPQWLLAGVESAADWAIRPVRAIAKLPERRFL